MRDRLGQQVVETSVVAALVAASLIPNSASASARLTGWCSTAVAVRMRAHQAASTASSARESGCGPWWWGLRR